MENFQIFFLKFREIAYRLAEICEADPRVTIISEIKTNFTHQSPVTSTF
jgi:hypothetical protein